MGGGVALAGMSPAGVTPAPLDAAAAALLEDPFGETPIAAPQWQQGGGGGGGGLHGVAPPNAPPNAVPNAALAGLLDEPEWWDAAPAPPSPATQQPTPATQQQAAAAAAAASSLEDLLGGLEWGS